jgi:PadR family transcriptional regulator, regulatory protein AphA
MSLEYAILGFLAYKPLTGYDLKKKFDNSVQHFWSADQAQIYRTLARLAEQGLAQLEVVEQSQRPDRKVYHITPDGREELHRWLAGPVPSAESRSASLIQIFFAGQLTDEQLLVKFEQIASYSLSVLATYQQIPSVIDSYAQEFANPREAFCWHLTLELGVQSIQAQLAWAESVIERIRNQQIPESLSTADE